MPLLIALGASAVLAIAALLIYNRMDWLTTEKVDDDTRLTGEEAKRLNALSKLDFTRKDPFDEKIDRMIEVFKRYEIDRFPLYVDSRAIFEFIVSTRKENKRWQDLSTTQRLTFPDDLRRQEPFSGRWRLAKLGAKRVIPADLPGYLDHRWVVVPRTFPNGQKDEAWFLVRNERGRPRIRGFKHVVTGGGQVVKKDEGPPEAPRLDHRPDFRKLDRDLKKAALPATTLDGEIDEMGHPTAPIRPVPLLQGTSPATVSRIQAYIATLTDPGQTLGARKAMKELVFIGKPAVPVLLNHLVGKDLKNPRDVYICHQVVQVLRDISRQRFGFEPQTGDRILTAATAEAQVSALKKWFGWWKLNAKTFEPELTPRMKKELERRKHFKERFGK